MCVCVCGVCVRGCVCDARVCVCVCGVCMCMGGAALFGSRCLSCLDVNFNIVFKAILLCIHW